MRLTLYQLSQRSIIIKQKPSRRPKLATAIRTAQPYPHSSTTHTRPLCRLLHPLIAPRQSPTKYSPHKPPSNSGDVTPPRRRTTLMAATAAFPHLSTRRLGETTSLQMRKSNSPPPMTLPRKDLVARPSSVSNDRPWIKPRSNETHQGSIAARSCARTMVLTTHAPQNKGVLGAREH